MSREPFVVFASNAFAILGLRSLYFLLAGMAGRFRYLNIGLGIVRGFVGIKMMLVEVYHLPVWLSLLPDAQRPFLDRDRDRIEE